MPTKQTFAIIKPEAVDHVGEIVIRIKAAGFTIAALKKTTLFKEEAALFYDIHKGRPFYETLIAYMSSGPIYAMILYKENAVEDFRTLIGPTDPEEAAEGTIRKDFGTNVQRNAVHGSDSNDNAVREACFFFTMRERMRLDVGR